MHLLLVAASFVALLQGGPKTPPADNKTKWPYTVTVKDAKGHPVPAKITVQILDPIGGVHAVQFDSNTKPITNHPIVGRFRDQLEWPPEARGFKFTFRVIVKALGSTKTLSTVVQPR